MIGPRDSAEWMRHRQPIRSGRPRQSPADRYNAIRSTASSSARPGSTSSLARRRNSPIWTRLGRIAQPPRLACLAFDPTRTSQSGGHDAQVTPVIEYPFPVPHMKAKRSNILPRVSHWRIDDADRRCSRHRRCRFEDRARRKAGITDPGYSADVETTGASRVRFSGVTAEGVIGSPSVCFRYG